MKEIVPNYYDKFNCIADKCKHNCCIGWEIDIDEDTMELYNSLNTPMGERIRENIEGDIPYFVLGEGDRCPFLNKNGLCDIICEHGDGALCDICYLHPRFKNFYSSFEETGLGLCCEEAARVILLDEDKLYIPMAGEMTKDEEAFLMKRQEMFEILQNRNKTMRERFYDLAEKFGLEFNFSLDKLIDFYLLLERLDDEWTEELNSLNGWSFEGRIFDDKAFQIPLEQLACYFIFRHLKDEKLNDGVKFTLVSCYLIGALWERSCADKEKMVDIARMYSSEIEYSDENVEAVIKL